MVLTKLQEEGSTVAMEFAINMVLPFSAFISWIGVGKLSDLGNWLASCWITHSRNITVPVPCSEHMLILWIILSSSIFALFIWNYSKVTIKKLLMQYLKCSLYPVIVLMFWFYYDSKMIVSDGFILWQFIRLTFPFIRPWTSRYRDFSTTNITPSKIILITAMPFLISIHF